MASTHCGASLWASASEWRLVAWRQLRAPEGLDTGDAGLGYRQEHSLCVCVCVCGGGVLSRFVYP